MWGTVQREILGLLGTCLAISACNGEPTPRSDVAVPVIQGLLVTDLPADGRPGGEGAGAIGRWVHLEPAK